MRIVRIIDSQALANSSDESLREEEITPLETDEPPLLSRGEREEKSPLLIRKGEALAALLAQQDIIDAGDRVTHSDRSKVVREFLDAALAAKDS